MMLIDPYRLAPSGGGAGFRYWRLAIDQWSFAGSVGTSGDVRVSELRYYTAASIEWPTSAMTSENTPPPFVASASSDDGIRPAYCAFDKVQTASRRWISSTAGGPQWLQIDMGSNQEFASIDLAPDSAANIGYFITDFRILASNSGSFAGEETTIFTATGLTSGWVNDTSRNFVF